MLKPDVTLQTLDTDLHIMRRPKLASDCQTIISSLEERIVETTRLLERALSDPKFSSHESSKTQQPARKLLLETCTSCALVLAWLYFGFLRQLEYEAAEMNAQQLDPTEITKVPYRLQRLTAYVGLTTLLAFVQHGTGAFNDWSGLTAYAISAMILSGASPTTGIFHTAFAAVYWTTLAFFLEPPFLMGRPSSFAGRRRTAVAPRALRSTWLRAALADPRDDAARVVHATLTATVLLQVLNLYDRGWSWQRWPVPVVLGSTVGWVLGNALVAVEDCYSDIAYRLER